MTVKTYTLLGPDRRPYQSETPATLAGHRAGRLYGKLDCPAALRAIARGGYVKNRVFFYGAYRAIRDLFPRVASLSQPSLAMRNGDAVLIKSDDEILPNHQIAVLLYSEDFALRQADAAKRFMRAYIRAVRFYNDALENGRLEGPTSDDVIAILSEATPIKSRDIYKLITPTGMNPDGRVNKASLAYDLAFYTEQGLVKGSVNLDDVVDRSFVEAALKELGPYRP